MRPSAPVVVLNRTGGWEAVSVSTTARSRRRPAPEPVATPASSGREGPASGQGFSPFVHEATVSARVPRPHHRGAAVRPRDHGVFHSGLLQPGEDGLEGTLEDAFVHFGVRHVEPEARAPRSGFDP